VLTLTREVERLRGALDVEHARATAAEQLATERAGRVEDLRMALRMLEAGSEHRNITNTDTDTNTDTNTNTDTDTDTDQVTPRSLGAAPQPPGVSKPPPASRFRMWLRGGQ